MSCEYTEHAVNARKTRMDYIERNIGNGAALAKFIVDRGHPDGPEIHVIDSMGVISIYNLYSLKLVTKLIARPKQISRYFDDEGVSYPAWFPAVETLAYQHQRAGMNQI